MPPCKPTSRGCRGTAGNEEETHLSTHTPTNVDARPPTPPCHRRQCARPKCPQRSPNIVDADAHVLQRHRRPCAPPNASNAVAHPQQSPQCHQRPRTSSDDNNTVQHPPTSPNIVARPTMLSNAQTSTHAPQHPQHHHHPHTPPIHDDHDVHPPIVVVPNIPLMPSHTPHPRRMPHPTQCHHTACPTWPHAHPMPSHPILIPCLFPLVTIASSLATPINPLGHH
ncbi:hypothetical protein BDN71DRAFT_83888 [Pleurotus eryngii]|uniref:Uncharacterized protein n=1 Tax=Pleurotus eryngii TaxID=5323 RepID=A0A9P5ZS57_PLEER|nr:hypothetical protein BDN71DRAFT_83888 [Pleurotus eryngii]